MRALAAAALGALLLAGCLLPQEDTILEDIPPPVNQPPAIIESEVQPPSRSFTVDGGTGCPDLVFSAPVEDPDLEVDGEMHVDAALSSELRKLQVGSSRLKGDANLLIMPTLDAANISFNLLKTVAGDGITVGPILLGARKAVHILTPTATVRRIVNMTALAVVDAQERK